MASKDGLLKSLALGRLFAFPMIIPRWSGIQDKVLRRVLLSHVICCRSPLVAYYAGTTNKVDGNAPVPTIPKAGSLQQQPTEPWVEVVHEATGQTYWWNQRTGMCVAAFASFGACCLDQTCMELGCCLKQVARQVHKRKVKQETLLVADEFKAFATLSSAQQAAPQFRQTS
jgi:hypothetical protein